MEDLIRKLRDILTEEEMLEQEPMSRHTTFKTGGAAELFLMPKLERLPEVILLLKEYQVPMTVIGNGSNLLVGDRGIKGAVLAFGKNAGEIQWKEGLLIAGAGTMLSKAAVTAWQNSYTGMEFAAGIPGSVGGGIVMNAGAYGGEIKDITGWVKVLTPSLEIKSLSSLEMDFSYRHSCVKEQDYLVLEAAFSLKKGESSTIKSRMDELKEQRVSKQPLEYPSAGSTFKRPEGHFAGKLIMDAGLAGYSIGGAAVSKKHCGFIINQGSATSEDIRALILHVQKVVEDKFHVNLEPEVKMLGQF